jgi:SPX domain protein involved in polyphosphate accumulation
MSDAAYTARPTNKAMAYERISKLALEKDDMGQYQHDSATKFCENVKRELAGMFNLLDRANGMSKLIKATSNPINTIKSIDAFTSENCLIHIAKYRFFHSCDTKIFVSMMCQFQIPLYL